MFDWVFSLKSFSILPPFQPAMGRRAKNKQAPPESIEPKPAWTSTKQLGKRKAEADDKPSPRPTKKVKDLTRKETAKVDQKSRKTKDNKKSKVVVEDDGSDGWEDVQDGGDLKEHAKSVLLHFDSQVY